MQSVPTNSGIHMLPQIQIIIPIHLIKTTYSSSTIHLSTTPESRATRLRTATISISRPSSSTLSSPLPSCLLPSSITPSHPHNNNFKIKTGLPSTNNKARGNQCPNNLTIWAFKTSSFLLDMSILVGPMQTRNTTKCFWIIIWINRMHILLR